MRDFTRNAHQTYEEAIAAQNARTGQAAADAAELERIALEQLAIDIAGWDYVVDLDHFVRGERLA